MSIASLSATMKYDDEDVFCCGGLGIALSSSFVFVWRKI